jgi:hypothetical protein
LADTLTFADIKNDIAIHKIFGNEQKTTLLKQHKI